MGDPLKFIDGIFNGIVQFVLNAVYSVAALLRDPVRGTVRLVARYKHDDTHQLSYVALLFLINCFSYLYYDVALTYPIYAPRIFPNLYTEIGKQIARTIQGADAIKVLIYGIVATAFAQIWIGVLIREKKLKNPKRTALRLGYLFVCISALWLISQIAALAVIYF